MKQLRNIAVLFLFLTLFGCEAKGVEVSTLATTTSSVKPILEYPPQNPNPYTTTTSSTVPELPPVAFPAPAPTTTTYKAPTPPAPPVANSANKYLQCVKNRESKGSYTVVNRSSGASGAYQFLDSTWAAMGFAKKFGTAKASYASPAQQEQAAAEAYARFGTQPWGAC